MPAVPVIDVTDLYHPHQDSDDNLDLPLAFGLPEVNLLGVVLDCHEAFRQRVAPVGDHDGLWADPTGPRDPGFVPVLQLEYIFDRTVPCAVTPFSRMRSPEDEGRNVPRFQQAGVELLLRLLRESPEPVHIACQGSARPVALAFNREPDLMREKIAALHLCLGSSDPGFLEWNVALDANAAVRVLTSGLPIRLYPCATADGPFALGRHNAYWRLETLQWIEGVHPRLRRYLDFAFSRAQRTDFLHAMDEDSPPDLNTDHYAGGHHLWTTAMWMEITGRRLVQTSNGYRLVHPSSFGPNMAVLPHAMRPCELEVQPDGGFRLEVADRPSKVQTYERDNPERNAAALNEAFPALYATLEPRTEPLEMPA